MILTTTDKVTPKWSRLIKQYRSKLGLNRAEFGALFGVSQVSVWNWENDKNEAPYIVTWMIYKSKVK